jgi:hypothetical protein
MLWTGTHFVRHGYLHLTLIIASHLQYCRKSYTDEIYDSSPAIRPAITHLIIQAPVFDHFFKFPFFLRLLIPTLFPLMGLRGSQWVFFCAPR